MEVTPLEVHHATREPTSPCRHERAFEDRIQLKENLNVTVQTIKISKLMKSRAKGIYNCLFFIPFKTIHSN